MRLTVEEIIHATKGELLTGKREQWVTGVSTDSRNINADELFVPLKGDRFDGHDYIKNAIHAGAAASLLKQSEASVVSIAEKNGSALIRVDDPLQALHDLANYYLSKMDAIVIGVTGSTGKTTTKEMIYSILSRKYRVLKNEGNYNNHIGVPSTAFQVEPEHEVVIFEMGMSGFHEIEKLCRIVKPRIGVITNIGASHIEKLGSRENIFKAKMEITKYFDQREHILIANGDDEFLGKLKSQNTPYQKYFVGFHKDCDFQAISIDEIGEKGIQFKASLQGQDYDFVLQVPGKHNIYNALCAIAIGYVLGVEPDRICEGIQAFKGNDMRLNIISTRSNIKVLDDSYNASPDSMKAAIAVFATIASNRKIAVLGDMLEMGSYAQKGHYDIGKEIARHPIDFLVTVGEQAAYIGKGAVENGFYQSHIFACANNQEAIDVLQEILCEQDGVLVKGSRGMKMEEIVEYIQERR